MTPSTTTLLPGIDRHGAGFRVRLRFPQPVGSYIETGFTSADDANARILELRRMRTAGLSPSASTEATLREACEALLARKAVSGLRDRGLEFWRRSTRPWREGPLAELPVSLLRREAVEDVHLSRAAAAAVSARNELQALKASLRYVGDRGARFDLAILQIQAVPVKPRKRRTLTVAEVELLAESAPAYARRLILFAATTGMRSGELFALTDDRLDFEAGTATVVLPKESEDAKTVELTREEVALLREQLLARAPGSRYVFPKAKGAPWTHRHFYRLVWDKATAKAAEAWREQQRLADDAATPFDDLTPHDLRSTAATLMRDAGFSREDAAARLGHADKGQLLDRVYDRGNRGRRVRKAIETSAPAGLRAAATPEPRRSPSPATASGMVAPKGS